MEPYDARARRLTQGETGEGTEFELEIKGFGKVLQELQEFSPNRQVRLVPHLKMLTSGHRFLFAADGNSTRIDLELEMTPKGFFKIFTPVMGMIGRKNLRGTAKALQDYMKGKERSAILL